MSNALHSYKVEAVVLLDVARNLTVGEPWSPLFFDGPAEQLQPLLCAVRWYCTVGISGVEHNARLVLKDWVNPH